MNKFKININVGAIVSLVIIIGCLINKDPIVRYIGLAGAIYLGGIK